MVNGMESFREHFRGYEDCYTVIGGAACDILMSRAALPFRATRDIDMVLLLEGRFEAFAAVFWDYVKMGGYRCGWKNSQMPHFYRFTEPQKSGFPIMIELFSRHPDFQAGHGSVRLTPLPVSDEISSLSAIMLDDDYYRLLLEGRRIVDGIPLLTAEYLILYKIRAWLDLRRQKAEGWHVNEKDLRKHKNDVFRLYRIADTSVRIPLPPAVRADFAAFTEAVAEEGIRLRDIGMEDYDVSEILADLHEMYIGSGIIS